MLASDRDIAVALKPVAMHANKYTRGSVLVICDSFDRQGAPKMAALASESAIAALRCASGYVTIAARRNVLAYAALRSPVYMLKQLTGKLNQDLDVIDGIRHDSTVVGPGLQDGKQERIFLGKVAEIEARKGNTVVVDAAAIKIMLEDGIAGRDKMVFTPHSGEFRNAAGIDVSHKDVAARIDAAGAFVEEYGGTLVLKGHETIIASRKKIMVNVAKTPALATMGSGDVLCGMIASLAALGNDPFTSAVAAVRAHSLAGDLLFSRKGMHAIATDIIDVIPETLKRFDIVK